MNVSAEEGESGTLDSSFPPALPFIGERPPPLAERAKAPQLTGAGQKALPAKRADLLLNKVAESVEDSTVQDR
jgi:hypothetical protein